MSAIPADASATASSSAAADIPATGASTNGAADLAPADAVADVRLVHGHLSEPELAAIAVVVSAMSVTSRLEARERALAEGADDAASAWMDPVHRLPRGHALRGAASPSAWQFSDR